MTARRKLTSKQEAFARAVAGINADKESTAANMSLVDAYRSAYDTEGMSQETAYVEASRLVANPTISLRISDMRDEAAESANVDDARLLREAMRLAYSDPINLFDDRGNILPVRQMSPATRAALASFEVEETYGKDPETGAQVVISRLRKVKLWDKGSAMDKLCKNRGLYERDNAQRPSPFGDLPRPVVLAIEAMLNDYRNAAADAARSSGAGDKEPAAGSEARTLN